MNIILMVAPVVLSPLVIYVLYMIIPFLLTEGSKQFMAMDLPGSMARKVGMDISLRCVSLFVISWVMGFGCLLMDWSYWYTIGFAIGGLLLAMLLTINLVKKTLGIAKWGDAMLVGLLAFAGGNTPIFITVVLLMVMETLYGQT